MSAGLIKHLKAKTEADANTEILMAQWSFDERIVGKSLENVGSYYPHFSSHNESHSQQILVNIERLLGSNIHQLTATDTWLILEAAYWHDIGMLFSAEEVQGLIKKDEFKDYVESLACDNTQDLHEFAKVWHHEGWQKALTEQSTPHSGVEKYRQMVAEWYRRGHAENSMNVVMKPFEKLAIHSPRTELLPQRIYRYLSQICYAHGRSFEEVMNELPFRQTGMGTEDCHPRFVACLLRLGDLFDIDDNRFCPVMAKQVSNMPALSATHEQKHKAIREFQLDNVTVSVTAVCSTEMAYIECRNWFDWIKEEIQNQMSQWKNIVPNREFGLLPTIDKLHVEMDDNKILLNNKPMKFEIDERSAIELLQGKNLYKNKLNIFRELFQNAVDATYIRLWCERNKNTNNPYVYNQLNPYNKDFLKILNNYPIIMSFSKVEDEDGTDYSIWKFSISDTGSGISLKDLEYIQKIAGSNRNLEKKRLINQMPIWMRPSGTFGIGIHSVFLLIEGNKPPYDKIYIRTRSLLDGSSHDIEMSSPISSNQGYCFISKNKENYLSEFGTTISFYIRERRRGVRYNSFFLLNANETTREIYSIQNTYDPIARPIHDYLAVMKKISDINDNIIRNSPLKSSINELSNNDEIQENKRKMIWNNDYSLFFHIKSLKDFNYLTNNDFRLDSYFKGQSVEELSNNFLMPTTIDFYGFNAKEALTLDRNEWQDSFRAKMHEEAYIFNLIKDILSNKLEEVRSMLNNDNLLSSILYRLEINNTQYSNEWQNLDLFNRESIKHSTDLNNKLSFKDLLLLDHLEIIHDKNYRNDYYNKFQIDSETNKIVLTSFSPNTYWFKDFLEKWHENSGYYDKNEDGNVEYYILKKEKINNNNLVVLLLKDFLDSDNSRMTLTSEVLRKANLNEFSYLCCSSKAHHNILGKTNKNYKEDNLLLPFSKFVDSDLIYININGLEVLIDSVYEAISEKDPTITRGSVEQSYKDLISICDDKMRNVTGWVNARKIGKNFKTCDISILQDKYRLKY